MKIKMLKVFGNYLTTEELTRAAEASARTFEKCRRFSLPVVDAVYGHGFEILLVDDAAHNLDDSRN